MVGIDGLGEGLYCTLAYIGTRECVCLVVKCPFPGMRSALVLNLRVKDGKVRAKRCMYDCVPW